jgi:hypothetical protein
MDRRHLKVLRALGQPPDPQPGTPEHDDQPAQPHRLRSVPRGSHLLHGWRVRRTAKTLVARHAALVKPGQGRLRPAAPGKIQQSYRLHDVLLWTTVEPHDPPAADGPRVRTAHTARSAKCLLLGTDCGLTRPHRVVANAIARWEAARGEKHSRPPSRASCGAAPRLVGGGFAVSSHSPTDAEAARAAQPTPRPPRAIRPSVRAPI